jgi:tetratricopeptide (TPR) repeat protein
VWIALVQVLALQKGREADARKVIEEAGRKLLADRRPLALAQCHEALNDQAGARDAYRRALAARPDDVAVVRGAANYFLTAGELQEAEPLLKKILGGAVRGTTGDRDWARHGLALVLASGTDYERFREALRLEGLQLDESGQLVRDRDREQSSEQVKSRARVLATQLGQRQFRKRALEMLEGLERNKALLASDRYVLAVLYEADGNWRKSQDILGELVQARPNAPQYVARLAHSLLSFGDPGNRAAALVSKLEALEQDLKVEENSFASVEMRARLEEREGKGEQAFRRLQKHVRRPGAKPEEMLLVLDSLHRQKRYAEAYALCERVWQEGKCHPEVVGGASVAVLRLMDPPPTDGQVRHLEKQLKDAIGAADTLADRLRKGPAEAGAQGDKGLKKANDRRMVLRLHLADLYDLRGHYPEAERLYAEVIRKENEPNNVVALNNLAWLQGHRETGAAEALRHVEAAINGIGRRADLLDTRGWVFLRMGRHEEALADFKEAAADAPTPTRLFHLAKAYHEARDPARARDQLLQATKLVGPTNKPLPSAVHPTEQEECRRLLAELKVP